MEVNWDRETAQRNERTHRITFEEASTVFFDPLELYDYDPDVALRFPTSEAVNAALRQITSERTPG